MKNPQFAKRFNKLTGELNSVPGLQNEVMRIIQIQDSKKRQKAIDRLPSKVKKTVQEIMNLIRS